MLSISLQANRHLLYLISPNDHRAMYWTPKQRGIFYILLIENYVLEIYHAYTSIMKLFL